MKKIFLSIIMGMATIVVSHQITCSSEAQENIVSKKAQWSKVAQQFATNLISGGLIGALTGKLFVYAGTKLPARPGAENFEGLVTILCVAIWIIEINARAALVHELNSRLEEQSIPHNPNLIAGSAWVASWLAWL